MKALDEFLKAVKDEAMKRELKEFLIEKKTEDKENEYGLIVEFAAAKGFEITVEELSLKAVEAREMTDYEMKDIVGGVTWCDNNFYCLISMCSCGSGYECLIWDA